MLHQHLFLCPYLFKYDASWTVVVGFGIMTLQSTNNTTTYYENGEYYRLWVPTGFWHIFYAYTDLGIVWNARIGLSSSVIPREKSPALTDLRSESSTGIAVDLHCKGASFQNLSRGRIPGKTSYPILLLIPPPPGIRVGCLLDQEVGLADIHIIDKVGRI